MGNFRVRVVENIGCDSIECFGKVGTELNVIDNTLIDSEGFEWGSLADINEVNEQFSRGDCYDTVFELVEQCNQNE